MIGDSSERHSLSRHGFGFVAEPCPAEGLERANYFRFTAIAEISIRALLTNAAA